MRSFKDSLKFSLNGFFNREILRPDQYVIGLHSVDSAW